MANKTLAEVKTALNNDKIHEVDTAFLVNDFGKYRPNITFVVPKDFNRNPIVYRSDAPTQEMLANMNIAFGGETTVLFGDCWESKKGGVCFRPKSVSEAKHVLIRTGWGGAFNRTRGIGRVENVTYYRRAASNGGGVGADFLIVPFGYIRKLHSDEVDGEVKSSGISLEDNAAVLRETYAQYGKKLAREAAAREVSRKAKEGGLGARLEKLNEQLDGNKIWLQDHVFRLGFKDLEYTEENVQKAEEWAAKQIAYVKEQVAIKENKQKVRKQFQPKFEVFSGRVKALDLEVAFGEERVQVSGSYGYPYSEEGIIAFEKELAEKESEDAEKKCKALSLVEDQKHIADGYPRDFTCRHERGHGRTDRKCWVVQPSGKEREADHEQYMRHKHVATVWNVVRPGEIALMWEKSSRASEYCFTVVHILTETLTDEQISTICEILEDIEESWDGKSGIASGKMSPSVGEGWLSLESGESLTEGFQTSRQKREQGDMKAEEVERIASGPFAALAVLKESKDES